MISPDRRERLRQLWLQDAGSTPAAQDAFDRLTAAYSETHRHYHTLEHLEEMFAVLESLEVRDPAVRFAAWYHDAVYDTHAVDNEDRSADLAVRELSSLNQPGDVVARVSALIRATDHETPPTADPAAQKLLDADLAILGTPPDRYARFANDIRKEYDWVPDELYRAGRAGVLRQFLDRTRIYFSEPLYRTRELAARQNLESELAGLTRGS